MEEVPNWENLARRLLGCMSYGITIEPDAGHHHVFFNTDADNFPYSILDIIGIENEPIGSSSYMFKRYYSLFTVNLLFYIEIYKQIRG